jgi:hypothetical protein
MSKEGLRNAEQMRIASEKARVHGIDPQLIWDVLGFLALPIQSIRCRPSYWRTRVWLNSSFRSSGS